MLMRNFGLPPREPDLPPRRMATTAAIATAVFLTVLIVILVYAASPI